MRRKNYRKKKRGPVVSNKTTYDGIKFASGLEKHMYIALKKAKIPTAYEGSTYTIFSGFEFNKDSYERCGNGKGEFKNRGNKKILPITYTPDFVGPGYIIECKGRANESFPLRWKLFKKYVEDHICATLYKPQNQKECEEVVKLIKQNTKKN
jgi:hypothetical protein